MNNEPIDIQYPECYRERKPISYIRLFHASPDAPPVDIYANGKILASNLKFKNFTQYLPVSPGSYNIKAFAAGTKTRPVIDTKVSISKNTIVTVAAAGLLSNISLYFIPETIDRVSPGRAYVRFAHLSPNAPSVDVTLADGKTLFNNVEFKEYTKYLEVKPGNLTLLVKPSDTNKTVLTIPNIVLRPNRFYTVYAVGLLGKTPPLQALIPLDGISYLKY